jgi:pyruvate kinase
VHYPEPRGVPGDKWQIDVDNNTLRILSVPTDATDLDLQSIDRP